MAAASVQAIGIETAYSPIHVRMAVTSHSDYPREGISLFNHDLMADSMTSWVGVNTILFCKLLNLLILLEVLFAFCFARHDRASCQFVLGSWMLEVPIDINFKAVDHELLCNVTM
jgi:hypothetical protein